MRICLLASGSKGNSLYIETGESSILVDAGVSARQLTARLAAIGVDSGKIDAVFITHEHSDHIRGGEVFGRKHRIPLYMSHATARACRAQCGKAEIAEFDSGHSFQFRDLHIDPFPTTHDACDPVGFLFEGREGKIGVATDLGIITGLVRDKLQGCRALVLESNHDEEMLLNGPYPWHLKQRIKSRHGHLSNVQSMELLGSILHSGLEALFLAHLSEANNDPLLARSAAEALLMEQNVCAPTLVVGLQHQVTDTVTLSGTCI